LEREKTLLVDELNRLQQLLERTKNDSNIQSRQILLLRDFYTEQYEISRHKHIEYLIRISNLFQELLDSNETKCLNRQNSPSMSFDEIKDQLDPQIKLLSTIHKSLLMKSSKDEDKSISNDLSLIITKFQDKFAHLFSNNGDDETILTTENENNHNNNPLLKNIISFLNNLYIQINKILHEKSDVKEKFISLDRTHRKYLKWETKLYKSITEDPQASVYLKQLANQMTEELDQFQEAINPRSTASSSISSVTTIGNNTVRTFYFFN
jgi:hypothetical protein